MIEVRGKYGSANVYTDNLENSAYGQIMAFCDQPFSSDSRIRIMVKRG